MPHGPHHRHLAGCEHPQQFLKITMTRHAEHKGVIKCRGYSRQRSSSTIFYSQTAVPFTVDARSKFTIPAARSQPDPLELLPLCAVAAVPTSGCRSSVGPLCPPMKSICTANATDTLAPFLPFDDTGAISIYDQYSHQKIMLPR